ncbi:hypothetical protein L798_06632 [Zootermopsis nevadensis]|uniref:Uncharacterized protein n=1 Tax=Zootermopsis nevadensis TaxID=136037 RepID=A0A067RA12_ZOONE|nr:hypothetical protein L798_06632 [Zootermopsis nevadensis]
MRGRTHKYVLPQNYPLNQYFNHVFRKICHALKKAAICGSETLVCSQQIRTALPPRTTSSTAKSRKPQSRNQPTASACISERNRYFEFSCHQISVLRRNQHSIRHGHVRTA